MNFENSIPCLFTDFTCLFTTHHSWKSKTPYEHSFPLFINKLVMRWLYFIFILPPRWNICFWMARICCSISISLNTSILILSPGGIVFEGRWVGIEEIEFPPRKTLPCSFKWQKGHYVGLVTSFCAASKGRWHKKKCR